MENQFRSPAYQPANAQWPDLTSEAMKVNVGPEERLYSAGLGSLLTVGGVRIGGMFGWLMAGAGVYMLFRGSTGYCPISGKIGRDTSMPEDREVAIVDISQSVTVDKPIEEVYTYWRKLENLPLFMYHLESVQEFDGNRSHWSARIPGGLGTLNWHAEIIQEVENEVIAWRSLPGADVENAGEVRFRKLPGDRGVEIEAKISYRPPAAGLGKGLAKVLNPVFSVMVKNDIARFGQVLETGNTEAGRRVAQPS